MLGDGQPPSRQSAREQPIEAVVIGASAGGIDALRVLLPALSRGLRVPIVVVVHLPARRKSLLPELFGSICDAPVLEPMDKQPVAGGNIWFAPSDYHLLVEPERSFALSIEPPVNYSRPSVDVLFEAAAHAYGPGLTGIVLSGANEDGAAGALTIRNLGGQVYVQDPEQALVRTMPEAAIRLATPQFVGKLAEIATLIRDSRGWLA
jgi:two-component system, chemotaxis family, protein-glutamate methylesterase/glutaminase